MTMFVFSRQPTPEESNAALGVGVGLLAAAIRGDQAATEALTVAVLREELIVVATSLAAVAGIAATVVKQCVPDEHDREEWLRNFAIAAAGFEIED